MQTDEQLIEEVKYKKNSSALTELTNRHAGLCSKIFLRYYPKFQQHKIDVKEFFDEKNILVYNSILSYKKNKKTKFSTWVGRQARYHCLNTFTKTVKLTKEENNFNFLTLESPGFDEEVNLKDNANYALDILNSLKDKRIKEVIVLRYFYDSSYENIAKNLGHSRGLIKKLHDKGLKILRKEFKKEIK